MMKLKKSKFVIVYILFLFCVSVSYQNNLPSRFHVNENESASFKVYSISEQTNSETLQSNGFFLTPIFNEYIYHNEINKSPFIKNMMIQNDDIILGDLLGFDLFMNEALTSWSIQSNLFSDAQVIYKNNQLHVNIKPERECFGDVPLKTIAGNKREQLITINIIVENETKPLLITLYKKYIHDEVHVGKKEAEAMLFSITNTNKHFLVITGLSISINIPSKKSDIEGVFLYTSDNVCVGYSSVTGNNKIYISILNGMNDYIITHDSKLFLRYSLKDTIPVSTNLQFTISNIYMYRTSSNRSFISTVNIMSQKITTVEKDKPVITAIGVPHFHGNSDHISLNIACEVSETGGLMSILYYEYQIYDCNQQRIVFTGTQEMYNQIASKQYSTNRVSISSNPNKQFKLLHNAAYQLIVTIKGSKSSKRITSDVFLVDLTPPNQPAEPIIKIADSSSKLIVNNDVAVNITVLCPQLLDIESGVGRFKIMGKSISEPYWKELISKKVSTENIYNTTIYVDPKNRYEYQLLVENNAGVWSEPSISSVLNIESSSALVRELFNVPNPFDSRKENTTIYYALDELANVDIRIYSVYGYLINRFQYPAGQAGGSLGNAITWDGTNQSGDKISRGVYYLILNAKTVSGRTQTLKYKIAIIH